MREPARDKFLTPLTDCFGTVLSFDPAREKETWLNANPSQASAPSAPRSPQISQ